MFGNNALGLVFEGDPLLVKIGDIITQNGKSYKVTKKTTTAIAVERYYIWDRIYDKYFKGSFNA